MGSSKALVRGCHNFLMVFPVGVLMGWFFSNLFRATSFNRLPNLQCHNGKHNTKNRHDPEPRHYLAFMIS